MKMKQLLFFLNLTFWAFCVLGCGAKETVEERDNIFAREENEGQTQNENDNGLYSVSASVKDEKDFYVYDGDEVVVNYEYEADGADTVGIVLLCDGIPLPFHTTDSGQDKIVQIEQLENGVKKEINLCFVPYGKQGDQVSLEIVDIIEPDFPVDNGNQEDIVNSIIRGCKYQVNYISEIHIDLQRDGVRMPDDIYTVFSEIEITEEMKKEYDITTEDNQLASRGMVNGTQSLWYTVNQGEKLDIRIMYYNDEVEKLVTSFYVNHELFPVFGDKYYASCSVNKEHITELKGTIDTAKMEKGRYVVYSACGNVIYNRARPTNAFVLEVK